MRIVTDEKYIEEKRSNDSQNMTFVWVLLVGLVIVALAVWLVARKPGTVQIYDTREKTNTTTEKEVIREPTQVILPTTEATGAVESTPPEITGSN